METALGPKDTREFDRPRKLNDTVRQKRVIQCEIRTAFVDVRSVVIRPCLRNRIVVAADDRATRIGLARIGIRDQRDWADEAVRQARQRKKIHARTALDFGG